MKMLIQKVIAVGLLASVFAAIPTVRAEPRKKDGSKNLNGEVYDDQAQKLNEYPQIIKKNEQDGPDAARPGHHPIFVGYSSHYGGGGGGFPGTGGGFPGGGFPGNSGYQGNFGFTGNLGNPVYNQGYYPGGGGGGGGYYPYPLPCHHQPHYPYPHRPYEYTDSTIAGVSAATSQQPRVPYRVQENIEVLERFSKANNDGSQEHKVVLSNGLTIFQKVKPYDKQQVQPLEGYYSQKLADNSYLTTFYKVDDKGYLANSEVSDAPPNIPSVKEMKALPMGDNIGSDVK